MKRLLVILMVFAVMFAALPASVSYAGNLEYKETVLDQGWDWATTLGKEGSEKEQILAQNKAERLKRHADKMAKQAKKDAQKTGDKLKKKFGV